MDIRARVVAEGALFRLEISVLNNFGGKREKTTKLEEKHFFSGEEARRYARNSHGLKDSQIT